MRTYILLSAEQIKQLNEPIEVKITEWNTGGLLTRIEVCYVFCKCVCAYAYYQCLSFYLFIYF
jgi:hypothetical protein